MTLTSDLMNSAAPVDDGAASPARPHRWMDPFAASLHTGYSTSTLAKLRLDGGGPKYTKVNNRIRYREDWCDEWLEAGTRTSSSDDGADVAHAA